MERDSYGNNCLRPDNCECPHATSYPVGDKGDDMEFESFEQALEICLNGEEYSPEHVAALRYCLENAPPELQAMFQERINRHEHDCGCGCKH